MPEQPQPPLCLDTECSHSPYTMKRLYKRGPKRDYVPIGWYCPGSCVAVRWDG